MSCGRQDDEDELAPAPAAVASSETCSRCRTNRPSIVVRVMSFCTDCFLRSCFARFKGGFRPARMLKTAGKQPSLLLCCSGGQASTAMLHLYATLYGSLKEAPEQERAARALSRVEVLYVDERGVPGHEEKPAVEEIEALAARHHVPFVSFKLESLFREGSKDLQVDRASSSLAVTERENDGLSPLERLRAFSAMQSSTSRASVHSALLQHAFSAVARERKHDVVLTGESATRIAIKALSGLSLGRGWSLGEETTGSWMDNEGLLHVRPLTQIAHKEVAFYVHNCDLPALATPTPATAVDPRKAGIETLLEDFVVGLDTSFPQTVQTVNKTVSRLGMHSAAAETDSDAQFDACVLCGLPAQHDAQEWRRAITIAQLGGESSATEAAADHKGGMTSLASQLCYGCLVTCQDGARKPKQQQEQTRAGHPDLAPLPTHMVQRLRGEDLRSQISDYLLEEGDG